MIKIKIMGFRINSLYLSDGYKVGHKSMLAPGTTRLYGTWIPRSLKHAPKGINKIVTFYYQAVWKRLNDEFNENFFFTAERNLAILDGDQDKFEELKVNAMVFAKDMSDYLGMDYDGNHFGQLWDIGYLPIRVKALPEGIETLPNIPHMTFINTVKGFGWLTLYLETIVSNQAWKGSTSATIAKLYRRQAEEWVNKTDKANIGLVDWMCHDFSSRGLSGVDDMITVGLGHATSFRGSDTLVTIPAARYYYNETEVCIGSVNASEHSVSTTKIFTVGEKQMIIDWLKEIPNGIFSMVCDTFSTWQFIEYLKDPEIKELVLNRNGKLVVRPDCLDDKSQILTPGGWKYFKDLLETDLVAQVKEDGTYEFVKPLKIINEPYEGDMYEIRDFHGKIDLVVTPNHRLVSYKNSNNSVSVKEASEYKQNYWEYKKLRSPKSQSKGRELTPYERFLISLQADGCIKYVNKDLSTRVEFNFQKERKHNRLLEILKNTDLEYNVYYSKSRKGQSTFSVLIPNNRIVSKTFDWVDTSNLDSLWAEQFIEELKYWDSSIRNDGRFKYDTVIKENIDVVELVAISAGKGVYISESEDSRKEHFSNVFTAHILDNPYVGGQSISKTKIQYKGTIHCVKVPTGMILVKRNKGVCVTGNSGDPADIICGKKPKKRKYFAEYSENDIEEWLEISSDEMITNILNDKEYIYELDDFLPSMSGGRDYTPDFKDGQTCYIKIGNRVIAFEVYTGECVEATWAHTINETDIKNLREVDPIEKNSPEAKGVVELLWDIFGGTVNEQGYKVLDPHIGAIYGDSITPERQVDIYKRLAEKGFASTNIVLGIGSFTYEYMTRDTLGFAAKGAWFEVEGEGKCNCGHTTDCDCVKQYDIYKDPITDDGTKKSLKGFLQVYKDEQGEYRVKEQCIVEEENTGELQLIYEDGKFYNQTSLTEIRKKLNEH